ncbi:MAG: hypothetical protein ACTSVU_09430 [Promethearchaeota archaeon]
MKKINIICPICSKFKRIQVPKEIFEIDEGSLLKIPILPGDVCEHKFIVILDYQFSIRDYEVINSDQKFDRYLNKGQKSSIEELEYDFFDF